MKTLSPSRFLTRFVQERSHDKEERIRLLVFLTGTSILLLFMLLHITGCIGLGHVFLKTLSWILLTTTTTIILLFLQKRISLIQACTLYGITAQLLESARIVFLAYERPPGYETMIVGNQIGSYTILLYLALGFVPKAPIYVTTMSLGSLLFAGFYDGGAINLQLMTLFILLNINTCILAHISQRGLHDIQRESHGYQATQADILRAFNMSQRELLAYLQLCRAQQADSQNTTLFFDQLNEQSKRNLIQAVTVLKEKREACLQKFAETYPQFSKTELEVCYLVKTGKPLGEIATIMKKSPSNISTVRGNIRKKLGLHKDEDLRKRLLKDAAEGS